jgi:predicted ester cyclase
VIPLRGIAASALRYFALASPPAQRVVAHINSHDVDAIAALLTPDHRFIDSLGGEARGREALRHDWRQYFRLVPDYRIDVDRVLVDGPRVVLLGVMEPILPTARFMLKMPGPRR